MNWRGLLCLALLCALLCVITATAVDVDCGSACDAVAPDAAATSQNTQQNEQFEDLVLPAAPAFIEQSSSGAGEFDAELETEDGDSAVSEGELMGEFEGAVELEGEGTAEAEAQQTIQAMQAAAAQLQANTGTVSESDIEADAAAEAEAEAEADADSQLQQSQHSTTMHDMRFSSGLRKPIQGKTTPIKKGAKKAPAKATKRLNLKAKHSSDDGDQPWPKPLIHQAKPGELPLDVSKLTPRTVTIEGHKVKLPPPVVIHQLKGQKNSGRKAPVDPEDPCFDFCHFEGGWSTLPCQQCLFRGMVNGWILHTIQDGVVGYNYAHWARNQCVNVKNTSPFHPVTFSDCIFNTMHNACNQ